MAEKKGRFEDVRHWNQLSQWAAQSTPVTEVETERLRDVLRFHEWRYYVQNSPLITDAEYDVLYKKLVHIEEENPGWITPASPTQRVGSDITELGITVKHLSPMLSLDNAHNAEDLRAFDEQIKKLLNLSAEVNIDYAIEPKYDGGGVSILYENDLFVQAATRGDGERGEIITDNIRTLPTVPLQAEFSRYGITKAEIRGEAIIRKDRFEKLNAERENAGLDLFANPRNAATGGLRTKNPKETADRKLDIFLYHLGYIEPESVRESRKYHSDNIELLKSLSFYVPPTSGKIYKGIEEVIKVCEEWEENREEYPYEIDGMVVKLNSLEDQEKCGFTAHHPRWAIAFKFKAKQAITQLLDVEFQVGKIGSITPVAKLTPVRLAGVEISSISLHNEDFIRNKDIRYYDYVLVERAGDVIPYIAGVVKDRRTGIEREIVFPADCPVCRHPLKRVEGESAWRCVNSQCEAQIFERMKHYASKDAMDIDGFGPAIIRRFRKLGFLDTIPDIYRLDFEKISGLKDFGQKSASNLQEAIERSKSRPIKRLLHGLSIHHVGKKVSSILAEHVEYLPDLQNWTAEQLTEIKDLGPVVAENIIAYFSDPTNLEMLKELEELGVNLLQTEEDKPVLIEADAPLVNKKILFTGTLETMSRKEAQKLAEMAGAQNISAVSGNLDILVVGKNAGSKLRKAQELGTVEIMTEEEFRKIIEKNA